MVTPPSSLTACCVPAEIRRVAQTCLPIPSQSANCSHRRPVRARTDPRRERRVTRIRVPGAAVTKPPPLSRTAQAERERNALDPQATGAMHDPSQPSSWGQREQPATRNERRASTWTMAVVPVREQVTIRRRAPSSSPFHARCRSSWPSTGTTAESKRMRNVPRDHGPSNGSSFRICAPPSIDSTSSTWQTNRRGRSAGDT